MGYLIIINKEDCATTTQKSSTMIYISLNWPVTISGNHVQNISINKWTIGHNNIKKAIQKHQPTQAFLHPIHVDNFADIKICSVTCFSNILNSCTWFFNHDQQPRDPSYMEICINCRFHPLFWWVGWLFEKCKHFDTFWYK